MDKLSAILARTVLLVELSCHPAEEIPPRKPRTLIAAHGNATGLPMDRTKSRALCNPPPTTPSLPRLPLTYTPGCRARERQGAHFFQFARVVHSTGDGKISGKENSFSFLPPPSPPFPFSSSFYYPIFPSTIYLSKHTGVPSDLYFAIFRPLHYVKLYVYVPNEEQDQQIANVLTMKELIFFVSRITHLVYLHGMLFLLPIVCVCNIPIVENINIVIRISLTYKYIGVANIFVLKYLYI